MCDHKENEDCMNCFGCGECREDLDEDGICPACLEETIDELGEDYCEL